MASAATKGTFQCPDCPRVFESPQGLGRHRVATHGSPKMDKRDRRQQPLVRQDLKPTGEAMKVREQLRDLATPLRQQLREISARLNAIGIEAADLRAARKDIENVLSRIDPSAVTNRQRIVATTGAMANDDAKRQAIRDFIEANPEALVEGFTAAELNRQMKDAGVTPVMAPDKTRVFVQQLQGEGIVRADRIVKGGGMRYMIVGNGDATS